MKHSIEFLTLYGPYRVDEFAVNTFASLGSTIFRVICETLGARQKIKTLVTSEKRLLL